MLDTITAVPSPAPAATRSLVDRDEYGPLNGSAGGLFTTSTVPAALLVGREDSDHRSGRWVPDGLLL
jgi:hypothetical protein